MPKPDDEPVFVRIQSGPVAKKITTVRLDEDVRERLKEHAETRGVSEAELIRQAIVFYLGWLHGQAEKPPTK